MTEHANEAQYNIKHALTAERADSAGLYASIAQTHALMLIAERLDALRETLAEQMENRSAEIVQAWYNLS